MTSEWTTGMEQYCAKPQYKIIFINFTHKPGPMCVFFVQFYRNEFAAANDIEHGLSLLSWSINQHGKCSLSYDLLKEKKDFKRCKKREIVQ